MFGTNEVPSRGLVSPGAEARGVIVQEWGGGVMNSDCHADSWGLVLEWLLVWGNWIRRPPPNIDG